MKVKVCGMREPVNIALLAELQVDWMGFIFAERSPRYAGGLTPDVCRVVPGNIGRVGVFVDTPFPGMLEKAVEYGLNSIQLHGEEPPDVCKSLRKEGFEVIKAFPVAVAEDFCPAQAYEGSCDYFLFDTKTPLRGGSGIPFDWNLLRHYTGDTPFLLSGGVGTDSVAEIKGINHPKLAGVDLNSRFEVSAGLKDIALIRRFIEELK